TYAVLWRLGARIFLRDWKSGELTILLVSLLLATATVTSISLFANRIENSIVEEATEFLAADARVQGTQPIPETWRDQAQQLALRTTNFMSFRAMAFAGEEMLLTQVKAVDDGYPLKGRLWI